MLLIDTNVVSEPARERPAPQVLAWLADTPVAATTVSILTTAQIVWGITAAVDERRRAFLQRWTASVFEPRYASRQLELTLPVLERWFTSTQAANRAGVPRNPRDALIAATAMAYSLTVVTRSLRDFQHTGLRVLDPWTGETHQMDCA